MLVSKYGYIIDYGSRNEASVASYFGAADNSEGRFVERYKKKWELNKVQMMKYCLKILLAPLITCSEITCSTSKAS